MARFDHGTLVASTAQTITVDGPAHSLVIVNHGSDAIYVTSGPVAADVPAPVVQADDTRVVPAGGAIEIDAAFDGTYTVKLISSGTPSFSVLAGEVL